MTRTHRTAGLALVAVMTLASACGDSSEDSLEQLIENETGEDVNIDFGDDGEINVQSDEGSFTLDDDGNFTAVGPDGEVVSGDIDVDGDSINVQSDDGNVVIEGDGETGDIEISSDDGDVSFSSSQEIPEEWPAEVPKPAGLSVIAGTSFNDGAEVGVTVIGTVDTEPSEYVAGYVQQLEAAGFPQTSTFEADGTATSFHETAEWLITVTGSAGDGETQISIAVISGTG